MNKSGITQALETLAQGDKNRSTIARLRDIFDAIELALSKGVTRAAILASLKEQGFDMPLSTFDGSMQRIRKERATKNQNRPAGEKPAAPVTPRASVPAPAAPAITESEHPDPPDRNLDEVLASAKQEKTTAPYFGNPLFDSSKNRSK